MSHKRKATVHERVKCAYCGRADVPVTAKGYMRPHVKPDGRRCPHGIIPHRPRS